MPDITTIFSSVIYCVNLVTTPSAIVLFYLFIYLFASYCFMRETVITGPRSNYTDPTVDCSRMPLSIQGSVIDNRVTVSVRFTMTAISTDDTVGTYYLIWE